MIRTLLFTILVEGIVAAGYCAARRIPVRPILRASLFINIFTQSLLWIVLNLSFRHYLPALLIAEILIWMIESLLLYCLPANRLRIRDAALLSLGMNGASFLFGWGLPL